MKAKKPKQKKSLFRRIVNIFIGIFAAFLILLVLLFGFSQTSTFRDLLRDNIVDIANNSLNGKLSIGEIDGSIFTSLILRDVSVDVDKENLLTAKKIDIKISPLQLLVKRIFFRSIELSDVNIAITENEAGISNIERLIKSSDEPDPPAEQTGESEPSEPFPYSIQVNNLNFTNINLIKKNYANRNSNRTYPYLNLEDFKLDNFNLAAKLLFHNEENIYQLVFDDFSGKTNISDFEINNLSGTFEITGNYANVKQLNIVTDRSNISISAFLGQIDLMGGEIDLENFQKYPLQLELEAKPFTFDDLSVFLSGTRILYGSPSIKFKADGQFGNFNIQQLIVDYDKTHLDLAGRLENLHTPENLFLDVKIKNSSADYLTARRLLPDLDIPQVENLLVSDFNMDFRGEPTVFHAKMSANVGKGKLSTDAYMDVEEDILRYDINFETSNLDLTNIVAAPTILTSKGRVQGVGLSPEELDAELDIAIKKSSYDNLIIDSLRFETIARSEIIEFSLDGNVNYSNTSLSGIVDFTNSEEPEYEINGNLDNFNLAMLMEDPDLFTDLNFKLYAEGKDLDLDKMTGEFTVDLEPSYFRDQLIDSTRLALTLERSGETRKIKLISDFVELNMGGEFSLKHAIDLLGYQSTTITQIIQEKFKEFNPLDQQESNIQTSAVVEIPGIIDSSIIINYDFEFDDFKIIAVILGEDKLDISGAGSGQIKSTPENFSISTDVKLDYLVKRKKGDVVYLSEFELGLNFSRDNRSASFENLFGTVSITGNRLYIGNNVTNISADLIFNADKLFYNFYGEMEPDVKAEAEGTLELDAIEQIFNINTLWVEYKNIEWENDDPFKVEFFTDSTHLANFNLSNEGASLKGDGYLLGNGNQNLSFSISELPGKIIDVYLLNTREGNLNSQINLKSLIKGTLEEPEIELNIDVNDVIVSGINFGNLLCDFNYINNNLIADISFINSEFDLNNPLLKLNGNVPIYLGFREVESRMAPEDSLSISLKSSNFNISTFGNLLPFIKNQSGNLEADVNIFGTLENLYYYGNLALPEAKFKVAANNLDYVLRLGMDFKSQEVEISQFEIANSGGTKYKGKMNGSGSFSLAGLDLDKFNLKLNGELAVLSNNSRGTSPSLYGDLVIASDGDWTIIRNKEEASFNGKVLIRDTDISFVPLKTSYTRSNREFVYNILVDSSKLDQEELKFKRLVSREAVTDAIIPSNNNSNLNFNYNVTVTIEDEAKFSFIFARAVNQGLKSIVNGKIVFESKNGQSRQQGAFTLLEGSKLEFFKALDATGTLRFESDLTNPYMDIVATYTGEYDENPDDQNNEVEEVAVRIKLIGPVSDMASNLTEESGNISVYRSRRNIDNNIPDSQLDAADAIVFLIMSKFKKDLTSSNKISLANEVIGTASSFVGPILTNLISSEVGDIINNIQFSTAGQQTKFQVSGRYQNFKYTLGGTDQTFSNIASADLKVEFLIIPKLLLRAERKSPYISYSSTSDFENKINELALKYRFEF